MLGLFCKGPQDTLGSDVASSNPKMDEKSFMNRS